MARSPRSTPTRRSSRVIAATPALPWPQRIRSWAVRAATALVLLAILAGLLIWWAARWTPSRDEHPWQGVTISAENGAVRWGSIKASGADFAYLSATRGNDGIDPRFRANQADAAEVGLRTGAVHHYSLCRLAADQAANFIRQVPRRKDALPSAVWLDFDPACKDRPTRALVLSELATFLAQIEAHMGKQSLIAPSPAFEAEYQVTAGIARTSWLQRNFFAPDYGAHRWAMWQANSYMRLSGADGTVAWNVVQQGEAR